MHTGQIWQVNSDYLGHEISNNGLVRNRKTGRQLRIAINQSGVQYVSIRNTTKNQYESVSVGVLVALTYVGPRTAKQNTLQYLDGDKDNNHASNLMWSERWHAMAYSREISAPEPRHTFPIQDDTGRIYRSVRAAAMSTGALPSAIDYAIRYNENAELSDTQLYPSEVVHFRHKVFPCGLIFTKA